MYTNNNGNRRVTFHLSAKNRDAESSFLWDSDSASGLKSDTD